MEVQEWIEKNRIFECRAGSHAYGLNTATSDEDFRGVAVPPRDYYMGLMSFAQYVTDKPDRTIFGIQKYVHLSYENNPHTMEYLFMPEDCILFKTPYWDMLVDQRDIFLSKKCRFTYSGYAQSQIKRIKTHRRWLLSPPNHKPTRGEFGLPEMGSAPKETMGALESALRNELNAIKDDMFDMVTRVLLEHLDWIPDDQVEELGTLRAELTLQQDGLSFMSNERFSKSVADLNLFAPEVLDIYNRERNYRSAMKEWNHFVTWKESRNPARAELEARFGYDTKHASHTVRLLLQGEEILRDGTLSVRLKDADREMCRAVRAGAWKYDDLLQWAKDKESVYADLFRVSALPDNADGTKVHDLLVNVIGAFSHDTRFVTRIPFDRKQMIKKERHLNGQ